MKRAGHLLLLLALLGCRSEMHNQPKYEALEQSDFFADEASARPLALGTIPRGFLRTNAAFYEGLSGSNLVTRLPLPLTRELLEVGRERYHIYCSVCHGFTGAGDGMIVNRGFPSPPSLHLDQLREAPLGHFYRVITYGYGVMFPYATRVEPADRWAIVAYLRTLQFAHAVQITNLPARVRAEIQEGDAQ